MLETTNDSEFLTLVFFWVAVFGLIGGSISNNKGHGFFEGFMLGGLLGIIGVIIVAVQKPRDPSMRGQLMQGQSMQMMRECPHCRSAMRRDASVCLRCQRESPAWTWHRDHWWTKDAEDKWVYLEPTTNEWMRTQQGEGKPSGL